MNFRNVPRIENRNLRLSLPDGTSALVCTTSRLVVIHHLPTPAAEPDWSARIDLDDSDLRLLFNPSFGWDVIELVGLVWRQVEMRTGMTIDLRRPEDRERAGLRVETVSTPSQYWDSRKPSRRRAEDTRAAIISVVEQSGRAMNRLEIARAVGRAKTPHLIHMIEGLVAAGMLNRVQSVRSNGLLEFFYFR